MRSISKGSSSTRRSFTINFGIPGSVHIHDTEVDEDREEIREIDMKKTKKVSVRRLAALNRPELPILMLGSIAAVMSGIVFPVFGLLLSSAIGMFYKPAAQLEKESKYWASVYLGLGCLTLFASPMQNYLFGIAGGKLIERIRSLCFEKIVHQQICYFDDPANTRLVYLKILFKNFVYVLYLTFPFPVAQLEQGCPLMLPLLEGLLGMLWP